MQSRLMQRRAVGFMIDGARAEGEMEQVDLDDREPAAVVLLRRDGFAHLSPGDVDPALIEAGLADWSGFAASWDRLEPDDYMNDGGRYRRRRHAVFALRRSAGEAPLAGSTCVLVERLADRPHLQAVEHNRLNGGILRRFAPVEAATAAHPALHAVLRYAFGIFDGLAPRAIPPGGWVTEVHQFRIEASGTMAGQPTPEGAHRDGVDWVLVMMIGRRNVSAGETSIFDRAGRALGSFTLTAPREVALVDDLRCLHGVTAVRAVDPSRPAYRDVLVVTLTAADTR